jgi:release factor glutamine methyltransferase
LRKAIKHIIAHTYRPVLALYLAKKRNYRYKDIILEVPPEVFHPGFFFSTQLLLQCISSFPIEGKKILELGAGSGLISIFAAKKGAKVTATDINPVALKFLKKNKEKNGVELEIIHSDLFSDIPRQQFDIIAINPPFYKKKQETINDFAWYCGENGEYFQNLFKGLREYIHNNSIVLMVLSEDCDISMIEKMAAGNGFSLQKIVTKKLIWEYLYIYKIADIQ